MNKREIDPERRFGGLKRLYGNDFDLSQTHIMVVGIGGVGSWAAEAIARSGVGQMTLCDLDNIAESNINRQIHAGTSTLGQAKVEAMAQRIQDINPHCQVNCFEDFVDEHNIVQLISQYQPQFIIDACDQHNAKVALILQARQSKIPFITCGSAGGKQNPLNLRISDLAETKYDALLNRLRATLRKAHGFPRGSDSQGRALKKIKKMNIPCVWLEETAVKPNDSCQLQSLSCAGYGSCVTVTASMGLFAANYAIKTLSQA